MLVFLSYFLFFFWVEEKEVGVCGVVVVICRGGMWKWNWVFVLAFALKGQGGNDHVLCALCVW